MEVLNQKYIDEHLIGVHTYESWARAIIEKALKELKTQLGTSSVPESELVIKFKISANTKGCITVCAYGVCVHVKV